MENGVQAVFWHFGERLWIERDPLFTFNSEWQVRGGLIQAPLSFRTCFGISRACIKARSGKETMRPWNMRCWNKFRMTRTSCASVQGNKHFVFVSSGWRALCARQFRVKIVLHLLVQGVSGWREC